MKITIGPAILFSLSMFVGGVLLTGCSDKTTTDTAASVSSAPASPAAAAVGAAGSGEAVFTANCKGCHAVNGAGGKKAPDLTHTGAEAEHTAQWFSEFIKNPKAKNPNSRMPGFEGRITDPDLQALSAYLVALK